MKMTITANDVKNLTGKFIVQLNSDDPDCDIKKDWEFYKEKRISFVSELNMIGFYYNHGSFDTTEEFVNYFNTPNGKDERFHKLLTNKELDFVLSKIKENNY